MTTYVNLGYRLADIQNGRVAPDNQGQNPGKWTVTFDPQWVNVTVPYFEVYKIVVTGAKGSQFITYIDTAQWDAPQRGDSNVWDPQNALPMTPGTYLYFYWSDEATDGHPPTVTIWMRYDQDIMVNLKAAGGQR
jgi:hypothetical protein